MATESNKHRVLIVEDDDDCRELMCQLVASGGYHCHGVGTAGDALRSVNESPPSVLLVDIGLPDMDGCELARRLDGHPSRDRMSLVALTGFVSKPVVAEAVRAGFDAFLSKPVAGDAILRLLGSLSSELAASASPG